MRFKRRPEYVDAIQLTDQSRKDVIAFVKAGKGMLEEKAWDVKNLWISPSSVIGAASIGPAICLRNGDYIIKHAYNAFEIVAKESFEMQYEKERTV